MKKFNLFLIISLALTAFLAGYIMMGGGVGMGYKTGTILDKFEDAQAVEDGEPTPTPQEETGPILLADRRVVLLTPSEDSGAILYFEKTTGKIFELNMENKEERNVSGKILPGFVSAVWSPLKNEAIMSFQSGSETSFKHFDILSGNMTNLDRNIKAAAFSSDANLAVYHYFEKPASESGTGKIMIGPPNGQNNKKIIDTRIESMTLKWPARDKIAVKTLFDIFTLTEAGKMEKVVSIIRGLEDAWSPSGNKLLFSGFSDETEDSQRSLTVKDLTKRTERNLELSGSAALCAWSIDDINVYCAIADSSINHIIYKIDTSTGEQKVIAKPLMPIRELLLTDFEEKIVFINASDDKPYSIKINN